MGTTPTTYILKPQLGRIPTASGEVDLSHSADNEHYCLALMRALGLETARTEITTFAEPRPGRRRVRPGLESRRPSAAASPGRPVPGAVRPLESEIPGQGRARGAADPRAAAGGGDPGRDRAAFFRSQILFWLIGATDGHAKNFSLFLRQGGRFELTPFYDVLTAQPAFDRKQIRHRGYRLAMSLGATPHYRIDDVLGRHFVESGKAAGLGPTLVRRAIDEVAAAAQAAPDRALGEMPAVFHPEAHEAITAILPRRLAMLETAYEAL